MKKYIKPITRIVELRLASSCLDGYGFGGASVGALGTTDFSASRKESDRVWDDEEEEENTGGWFQ